MFLPAYNIFSLALKIFFAILRVHGFSIFEKDKNSAFDDYIIFFTQKKINFISIYFYKNFL